MANLYDINTQIESLLTQLPIDEDTGEILPDAQAICTQLAALDMERRAILKGVAFD